MNLGEQERRAYEWHMKELSYQASMYQSSYHDGRLDGEKKGMEKGREAGRKGGREQGRLETARLIKEAGEPMEKIVEYSWLTLEEIAGL